MADVPRVEHHDYRPAFADLARAASRQIEQEFVGRVALQEEAVDVALAVCAAVIPHDVFEALGPALTNWAPLDVAHSIALDSNLDFHRYPLLSRHAQVSTP